MKTTCITILIFIFCSFSEAQTAKSGYVNVGNDKIYYEMAVEGPAIIFIHDGVINNRIWDEQFAFFSKNYKVIRYDRRRYGNSTAATEPFSDLEDLNTLCAKLNIEKACLAGLSSGGRLAINFTLKYPQKVTALILSGAIVEGFSFTEHFDSRGGHYPSNIKNIDEARLYDVTDDPYEIYSENKTVKEKLIQLVKDYPTKGEHNVQSTDEAPVKPAYQRLNEIKVPTLILVGEYDIPDVHAHAGAINAGIVNSKRIIINKAGHLLPFEQPVMFNNAVADFLKRTDE